MLLPLQGVLLLSIRTPMAVPWAMSLLGFQPVSHFLYKHWTKCSCLHHSKYRMSRKGLLLHSERTPFTLQKDSFCNPKRTLLQPKRTPFEKRRKFKGKGKREKGKINWIFYPSKTKNDTNPRLPPCSCRPY